VDSKLTCSAAVLCVAGRKEPDYEVERLAKNGNYVKCHFYQVFIYYLLFIYLFTNRKHWRSLTVRCVYFEFVINQNNRLSISQDRTKYRDISSLSTLTGVVGNCPLPPEIFAESDPPSSKNTDFDRYPLITSQP